MPLADFPAVAALPLERKKVLFEELRDEIALAEGPDPLTEEDFAEFDRRMADGRPGLTWEQVKANMEAARRGAAGA